jgi:carboxylesterase
MAKAPLGVLLLHGLSSHINCIDPVVARLEKHNIPYRMPALRGHGTQPENLVNVRYTDWLVDGHKAFYELVNECEKVVIVALSMGSLVGINLTLAHQDSQKIAGLVCIAPALAYYSKIANFARIIGLFQKRFNFDPAKNDYYDQERARLNENYAWIPSSAVVQLLDFQKFTRHPAKLAKLNVPLLILQGNADRVIDPAQAQILYNLAGTSDKKLVWFDKTGHEMLRDYRREDVLDEIEQFVVGRLEQVTQMNAEKTQMNTEVLK